MIVTTTAKLDGHPIQAYLGVVSGEAILGANVFRDLSASWRDLVGGRTKSYEETLIKGRDSALAEAIQKAEALGANALIGVDIDYEAIDRGEGGSSMLLVSVSGTAVRVAG